MVPSTFASLFRQARKRGWLRKGERGVPHGTFPREGPFPREPTPAPRVSACSILCGHPGVSKGKGVVMRRQIAGHRSSKRTGATPCDPLSKISACDVRPKCQKRTRPGDVRGSLLPTFHKRSESEPHRGRMPVDRSGLTGRRDCGVPRRPLQQVSRRVKKKDLLGMFRKACSLVAQSENHGRKSEKSR